MEHSVELFTIGYQRWPAKTRWARLLSTLKRASIELLIDVRHSPCSSNTDPSHNYGPRDWHVQAEDQGIVAGLRTAGIRYIWLVELGNPQKKDSEMRVLQSHVTDTSMEWPIHRGIWILKRLVLEEKKRTCLMCACKSYETCHRKLIVEVFSRTVCPVQIRHQDLSESLARRRNEGF